MESSQDNKLQRKCMDKKWLDLRVFYVRISSCPLKKIPQFLSVRLLTRDFSSVLEVNGEHIAPSKIAASVLRRDRIDKECEEVTYVSTDNVRTTGPLRFEVYHKDVLLVCGKVDRLDTEIGDNELVWSMDCCAAFGLVDWVLLRGNPVLRAWSGSTPVMEVYVAGCCSSGSPVIFTKKLQLLCRRSVGRLCLDAIPEEEEETERPCENREKTDPLFQLTNCSDSEHLHEQARDTFSDFDLDSERIEEEDGELSWFNAGVSVGVGIGLGMCLAIGVGVGLLTSTYQTATKAVRRRWL